MFFTVCIRTESKLPYAAFAVSPSLAAAAASQSRIRLRKSPPPPPPLLPLLLLLLLLLLCRPSLAALSRCIVCEVCSASHDNVPCSAKS